MRPGARYSCAHESLQNSLDGRRPRSVQGHRRPLHRNRDGPARREVARAAPRGSRDLAQGRRDRPVVVRRAVGVRRWGRRLPPRSRHVHRAGPSWHRRVRPGRAQHVRALRAEPRHRGAETSLAAALGLGRIDRRDLHDRTGDRLGPQRHPHPRREAGRSLRRRRRQDLHHQRLARGTADAGGAHRCRGPQSRSLHPHGGDPGSHRLSRRTRARQDGPARPGHLGTVLRRREGAGRQPARRRGRQGHAPAHARPAV